MMNVSPVSALITPLDRRGHRKQSLPPPSSHSEARPWWQQEEEPVELPMKLSTQSVSQYSESSLMKDESVYYYLAGRLIIDFKDLC